MTSLSEPPASYDSSANSGHLAHFFWRLRDVRRLRHDSERIDPDQTLEPSAQNPDLFRLSVTATGLSRRWVFVQSTGFRSFAFKAAPRNRQGQVRRTARPSWLAPSAIAGRFKHAGMVRLAGAPSSWNAVAFSIWNSSNRSSLHRGSYRWLQPSFMDPALIQPQSGMSAHSPTMSTRLPCANLPIEKHFWKTICLSLHARLAQPNAIAIRIPGAIIVIETDVLLPRRASGTVISATLLLIMGEVLRVRMLLKLDDGLGEARASAVRQLQAIAADLRITPDHLHDVTSQAARTSPLVIIDDRSIFEGQRALSPTDKRIAQVGFDCGFADAAHFSRFFGARARVSPRAVRHLARASKSVCRVQRRACRSHGSQEPCPAPL